jgi:hypothetical protein
MERLVKAKVSAYLRKIKLGGVPVYYRMPVPSGYGRSGLDYEGCLCGRFFAIETKAPGQQLTIGQRDTALAMTKAGGQVFIISSEAGLDAFRDWVLKCQKVSASTVVSHYQENQNSNPDERSVC